LGLTGTEVFDFSGIEQLNDGVTPRTVRVTAQPSEHSPADAQVIEFDAVVRIDTPGEADYYRNGGILQYVLRSLVA
jgi:aconitate hydratase